MDTAIMRFFTVLLWFISGVSFYGHLNFNGIVFAIIAAISEIYLLHLRQDKYKE